MAVLLRDPGFPRPLGVAGLLIVALIVSSGCQGGPTVRGQSPEATAPPRLRPTPEPSPGRPTESPLPDVPRSVENFL
ncbi:MAG: hypothetical protein CM1200mP2_29740 [Planctomycetaceae bacterium]|nr:MAG: hypothetical protein CM1200mP2_29740 [Planctomycetaceae bacterium]